VNFIYYFIQCTGLLLLVRWDQTVSVESVCSFVHPQMMYEWKWIRCGMILTGENRMTGRKNCSSATVSTTNHTWTALGVNWGPQLRGMQRSTVNVVRHLQFGLFDVSRAPAALLRAKSAIFIAWKLTAVLIIRYVTLNIIEMITIIVPKTIKVKTRTQDILIFCAISSLKQTNLVLAPFFYPAWFPNSRKRLNLETKPEIFSAYWPLFLLSPLWKKNSFVLAPFLYRSEFPSYRNRCHRESNSEHFQSFALLCPLPCLKE
jgi:hypothetical protein